RKSSTKSSYKASSIGKLGFWNSGRTSSRLDATHCREPRRHPGPVVLRRATPGQRFGRGETSLGRQRTCDPCHAPAASAALTSARATAWRDDNTSETIGRVSGLHEHRQSVVVDYGGKLVPVEAAPYQAAVEYDPAVFNRRHPQRGHDHAVRANKSADILFPGRIDEGQVRSLSLNAH